MQIDRPRTPESNNCHDLARLCRPDLLFGEFFAVSQGEFPF